MAKLNSDEALQIISSVVRSDRNAEYVVQQYETSLDNYDELMGAMGYKGPGVIADAMVQYLNDKRDVEVLDVASGPGSVGYKLKEYGFTKVDALDPANRMIELAGKSGNYRNLYVDYFPCVNDTVKTSSYDVLASSGGLAAGLMKCDCLPEFIRCVRPGGLVFISGREGYLTSVEEYKDRFEPLMEKLEKEGQWKLLERRAVPNLFHDFTGVLWVLKVTKHE